MIEPQDQQQLDSLRQESADAYKRIKELQAEKDYIACGPFSHRLHDIGQNLRRLKDKYQQDQAVESVLTTWRGYMADLNMLQIQLYHVPSIIQARMTCVPWSAEVYAQMLKSEAYDVIPLDKNLVLLRRCPGKPGRLIPWVSGPKWPKGSPYAQVSIHRGADRLDS